MGLVLVTETSEVHLGYDERLQGFNVKISGLWIVSIIPMIFNDRITLTHIEQYPFTATGGWCYDRASAAAIHAAEMWDPLEDSRPVGFKKEAYFDEIYYYDKQQELEEQHE